jgi:hypothetical protein
MVSRCPSFDESPSWQDWIYPLVQPKNATKREKRPAHRTHEIRLTFHGRCLTIVSVPKQLSLFNASLLRVVGCHCGTLHVLALAILSLAEEVDRLLASEMGWSQNVRPIHGCGPDGLCGFRISPGKRVSQATDDATCDSECAFAGTIGNREQPACYFYPGTV